MPKPKYNHPFIKYVRHECRRYKVRFILQHTSEIEGAEEGESCGGYFTDEPLELAVATRTLYTDFLSALVHEYSHMCQWRDESPYFLTGGYGGTKSWDVIERWVRGEEFKKTTIKKCIDTIRDCELDCDRRAIKIIKNHKLPINIEKYCQRSSAYIYFHNFMKLTRKWDYRRSPTHINRIIDAMPTNLEGNYSVMPRPIMRLFKKHVR